MKFFNTFLSVMLCACSSGFAASYSELERDLAELQAIENQSAEHLPIVYNNFLTVGHINMPSARTSADGVFGAGYSEVEPYRIYSLRTQLFPFLEVSGNYRIFKGLPDLILSPFGFGDRSDKGANVKLILVDADDPDSFFPGFAIGMEDFLGTQGFYSQYAVFTKTIPQANLELTLGYGRLRLNGVFGGATWWPLRDGPRYLQDLSFVAEYDSTDYKDHRRELHPDGRNQSSPVNFGVRYQLGSSLQAMASYVRGEEFSFAVALNHDLSSASGFMPKYRDPLPYDKEEGGLPLGVYRDQDTSVGEITKAFSDQGLRITRIGDALDLDGQKVLCIQLYNERYLWQEDLRLRLNFLLASLLPSDVDTVLLVVEADGFPVQEYHFCADALRRFQEGSIGEFELRVLSPANEVGTLETKSYHEWKRKRRSFFNWSLFPKTHTLFGSSKGKFKYGLGLGGGVSGILPGDIYYCFQTGRILLSELEDCSDTDMLNPSQIINVRSDSIRYLQRDEFVFDQAFLQRTWNVSNGWYFRAASGYFELAYAGGAAEVLYYPVNSHWAVGVEAAYVYKRDYSGFGITRRVRKLEGFTPTFESFIGRQAFVDFYYDWPEARLGLKVSAGQFLAKDKGAKVELTRRFASGLELNVWYAYTDAKDVINQERYHDKGVSFSMPLDVFFPKSSKRRWGYGMSAWLRDIAARSETGHRLYSQIHHERQQRVHPFIR